MIALDEPLVSVPGCGCPQREDKSGGLLQNLLETEYRLVAKLGDFERESVRDEDDIQHGDVVVYRSERGITHSALVWNRDRDFVSLLSKFGQAGEYFHSFRDVPAVYGKTVEFWTDRR